MNSAPSKRRGARLLCRLVLPAFASVLLGLVGGCVDDGGTNTLPETLSSPPPDPDPPADAAPDPSQQQFTVDASGGTVRYQSSEHDVSLTLTFPPGALAESTEITVQHARTFPNTAGLVTGAVFEFGPTGLAFGAPVELSIAYASNMIGALTEGNLRIHRAVGVNWVPLLGGVDTANKAVDATLTGFSIYGLKTIPPLRSGADTWATIQADILQTSCVLCHNNTPTAPMGLSWEADQYDAVVGNRRLGNSGGSVAGAPIINPGNSAGSAMIWKLNGQGPNGEGVGLRMPATGLFLSQAQIARIAAWIDAGAPGVSGDPPGTGGGGDPGTGGGGDPGTGGGGDPGTGGGGGDPAPGGDTWATIQADFLQTGCVLCHNNTPAAPMGLSWEADQYDAVVTNGRVGNAGGSVAGVPIIVPGNSAGSAMIWKLNGQGPNGEGVGLRMPATGLFLSQAQIARIAAWIDAGAPGVSGDPPGTGGGGDPGTGGGGDPGTGGGGDPGTGGGGDPGTGGGGDPGTGGGGGTPDPSAIVPTWYGVQANILGRFCTMCHSGAGAPMGLSWEIDQYATIVTNARMSGEVPTMPIIDPGNPNNSYMYWKITGNPGISGARMPATGVPLDQALIDVVEQWIFAGAPLGDPADAEAGGGGGAGGPTYPVGSWMYVWSESLQVCTMCHSLTPSSSRCGADIECPPKGVVLTADNYIGVVDDSIVRPFRPDNSELWERVTEDDPDKRMPFGMAPLTQRQLGIIQDWIQNGAPFCPSGEVCP
ncbi:MAG: hypothetical protein OET44_16145 [Gammaproteobacteria bacterium]|nr:hypothetical protein [Gammaproteobacteria bacterium]